MSNVRRIYVEKKEPYAVTTLQNLFLKNFTSIATFRHIAASNS